MSDRISSPQPESAPSAADPLHKPRNGDSSAVRSAASRLRKMVLAQGEGGFLGSEEELIRRLDISRPTFRQAARLLEHEQLLRIRRGPGGGFFSRRPSMDGVVHMASICLMDRQARLIHMVRAGSPLMESAAEQAAGLPDQGERARLLAFCADNEPSGGEMQVAAFVRLSEEFSQLLESMTGNPVMALFLHIVRQLAAALRAVEGMTPEYMQSYWQLMQQLAQAVNDGDVEIARIVARRLNKLTEDRVLRVG